MRVLVSDPIVKSGPDLLRAAGIEVLEIPFTDSTGLVKVLPTIAGWVIRSGSKVTAEHLAQAPNLKVVGRAGVGIDNVDLTAATLKGVVVMNTPGGNTVSAAEHTLALMLALFRNIPKADASLKAGGWDRKKFTGNELRGKILGVIGLGRIGLEVIKRARSFQMEILAYDPFVEPEKIGLRNVTAVALDQLISASDVITLHIPKNKATDNLIDTEKINKMKPGVRLINCARGGLINEAALVAGLKSGQVAGAAIDVYLSEPPTNSPLMSAPNIVLTPHLGASTVEAGESVALQVCEQVRDYLLEQKLTNAVNVPIADLSILKQIRPVLDLAERMGYIMHHLQPGAIREVRVTYGGDADHLQPLMLSSLMGLMRERNSNEINYINARSLAEQKGMLVVTVNDRSLADFQSAVALGATGKDGSEHEIVGYTDQQGIGRLIRLDGYAMDIKPEGILLLIENDDVPGVVGNIGTLLGNTGINIAAVTLSRNKQRKSALSIVRCDQELPEKVLAALQAISAIKTVRQIA